MSTALIHLSDIHFGQEVGGVKIVHDDAKARLVEDVRAFVQTLPAKRASGAIVSGDIAYAGKKEEYVAAGGWLDAVAAAAGCAITDIQVVPGNHDIDRDSISKGVALMLAKIVEGGEAELDGFLMTEVDKQLLYGRFSAYHLFAQGYQCPLDKEGGGAGERTVDLAQNRTLRFIGLNTALACTGKDKKGTLLLGSKQRVLPKVDGEELVVIAHHPMDWVSDAKDATKFLLARARIFIAGHEHNPSVRLEKGPKDSEVLIIAAGATVPPVVDEVYVYTYNIIEFALVNETSSLKVTVHTREWSDDDKEFGCKKSPSGGDAQIFTLRCPNFAASEGGVGRDVGFPGILGNAASDGTAVVVSEDSFEPRKAPDVPTKSSLLRLHFFRDLNSSERLSVLLRLNALPDDSDEPLTHSLEGRVFDAIIKSGKVEELERAVEFIRATRTKEQGHD